MAQTWDNDPAAQQNFINNLDDKFRTLQGYTSPLTAYGLTAPTNDVSSRLYEEVQWLDPSSNTLKNSYIRSQDLAGGATSQRLAAVVPFPTLPSYTLLDWISTGESVGATTQSFSNIDQRFKHLVIYLQIRSTANATNSTCLVRPNGLATTTYGYNFQAANTGASLGAGGNEQTGLAGFSLSIPANTAWKGYFHEGLMKLYDYTSATAMQRVTYRGAYAWANPPAPPAVPTTHNNVFSMGINTSLLPITSLSFVFVTGLAPGSRICLFGV